VNHAIPLPQNPWRGASDTPEQARGRVLFQANCASCHSGAFYTDSAAGNPTLDLAGTIVLHDVGTCVTAGPNPDRMQPDVDGRMHEACKFDTPTLRGIFATPPYLHDGSARTLRDVLDRLPASRTLSDGEKSDLVEFLKTL
jgi:cytochrome c peroxidase